MIALLKEMLAAVLLGCGLLNAQGASLNLDVTDWLALHPEETVYGLTMTVGEQKALVNGVTVELQGAPFVEDDVFYFPLEDVAELYGDTVEMEGEEIRVLTDEGVFTMFLDSDRVMASDGTTYVEDHGFRLFLPAYQYRNNDGDITPRLRDGLVYVPCNFSGWEHGGPGYLSNVSLYPESGFVIFDLYEYWENEFRGFTLLEPYDTLPASLREQMVCRGSLGETRDYYDEVEYRGDGFSVYVARLRLGCEDGWQLDGVVTAIVIDDRDCPTYRGLRCGDPAERAWQLYGYAMVPHFGYEVKDGRITRIGFNSYYTGHAVPSPYKP